MSSSFYIKFNDLYRSIFIYNCFISTDPNLNVISCGRRQLYIEPRWWVEGATGASETTTPSIPQRVTTWIESTICLMTVLRYACLKEVVLAHKWGNASSTGASSDTEAYCSKVIIEPFIKTTDKATDVLAGRAICHTYSIKIVSVNWQTCTIECI